MGDCLLTCTKTSSAFHSSGICKSSTDRSSCLGLRRGTFTCVGWQVTPCDLMRQEALRSSKMGFSSSAVPGSQNLLTSMFGCSSTLKVNFNVIRWINLRFTNLLTCRSGIGSSCGVVEQCEWKSVQNAVNVKTVWWHSRRPQSAAHRLDHVTAHRRPGEALQSRLYYDLFTGRSWLNEPRLECSTSWFDERSSSEFEECLQYRKWSITQVFIKLLRQAFIRRSSSSSSSHQAHVETVRSVLMCA